MEAGLAVGLTERRLVWHISSRLGYPVRIKYADLSARYLHHLRSLPGIALLSPKLFTELILEVCALNPGEYTRMCKSQGGTLTSAKC